MKKDLCYLEAFSSFRSYDIRYERGDDLIIPNLNSRNGYMLDSISIALSMYEAALFHLISREKSLELLTLSSICSLIESTNLESYSR